jgi:hypothetical protein
MAKRSVLTLLDSGEHTTITNILRGRGAQRRSGTPTPTQMSSLTQQILANALR